MIRHGSMPYLECSSKGFKSFSAFYARVKCRGNKTIETIYQAAKIFEDGSTGLSIKQAKGRRAVNTEEVAKLYAELWADYIDENPHFKELLYNAAGLSDIFGQAGSVCQATELWKIKQTIMKDLNWKVKLI